MRSQLLVLRIFNDEKYFYISHITYFVNNYGLVNLMFISANVEYYHGRVQFSPIGEVEPDK